MKNVAHPQARDKKQQSDQQAVRRIHSHRDREGHARQKNRRHLTHRTRRVQGQRDEQGRQREIQALDLRGNQRPREHSYQARHEPREVEEHLHRQEPRLRPPVGARGRQGVGLVDQGVHRKQARNTPLDRVQREREREKEEAEVHQQHRHRDDRQRRVLRAQGNDEELGRPRVGGQGQSRSQPPRHT